MVSSEEEIIACYACAAPMNVAEVPPYSRVVCPACKTENRVKKQFGPYVLTRRHANGGMSSVFIAKDKALDREVALKILSEDFSKDQKRITAFEEEARLTASLSHPNIVRVLTTGKAFGRLYIAMEFVPGGHFEQQIKDKGKVLEADLLPLAIQVAEGLKSAQAAGLIHRDIKPGNILLDAEGNAKIVDFGLALVTKGGKAKATEIWATPYYVPPEAIEGQAEDFRADVYAFGATLYHALAGKPPCDEETMASEVLREAKKKVVPLKKAAPHVDEATCAVIDRAMAYEPADRFGSYDEMIVSLQGALKIVRGESQKSVDGVGYAERREEFRARNRRKLLFAALGLLIGIFCLAALIFSKAQPPKVADKASSALTLNAVAEEPDESPREVAARYATARRLAKGGDFPGAGKFFIALLRDQKVEEPTRTWAGLQAVASALMDGQGTMAKQYAEAVKAHFAEAAERIDPEFATGTQPVIEGLGKYGFFEPELLKLGDTGSARFFGYFLAGLKNWENGNLLAAIPFFKNVSTEPSISGDPVLGWYQEIAGLYLADYGLLNCDAYNSEPATATDCREAIEELNRVLTLIKTKGRASFNVRARLLEFSKLETTLKAAPAREADESPDLLSEITSLAADYKFDKIVDLITGSDGELTGQQRESLLGIAQSALVFLAEIESDLAVKPVPVELVTRDTTAVVSIFVLPAGALSGALKSGESRALQWTDFPPEQLIKLHRELVKSPRNEFERLRRHESAIAFEWLAGDRTKALEVAERLAEESPSFRVRWSVLAAGLPE